MCSHTHKYDHNTSPDKQLSNGSVDEEYIKPLRAADELPGGVRAGTARRARQAAEQQGGAAGQRSRGRVAADLRDRRRSSGRVAGVVFEGGDGDLGPAASEVGRGLRRRAGGGGRISLDDKCRAKQEASGHHG